MLYLKQYKAHQNPPAPNLGAYHWTSFVVSVRLYDENNFRQWVQIDP